MKLAEFIEDHHDEHLAELCEFLRIPSVSAKSEHKPDIERAARWVSEKLRAAGFKKVEIVPTNMHPLVYAAVYELSDHPDNARAKKYFPLGPGAVMELRQADRDPAATAGLRHGARRRHEPRA